MALRINESIKRLRLERGLTQERLAEYMNVSPQAVSKWEKGQAYPDIAMVPALATFFGVPTDTLFDMDGERNQERIKSVLSRYRELNAKGQVEENMAMLKEALNEFPGEHKLRDAYAGTLFGLYGAKGDKSLLDRIIETEEMVLIDTTDDELRYNAIQLLTYCYRDKGDKESAKAMANRLPSYLNRDLLMASALDGDERMAAVQQVLHNSLDFLQHHMVVLSREYGKSGRERDQLRLLDTVTALMDLLLGDESSDMCSTRFFLQFRYAEALMDTGRYKDAVKALRKGVVHAMMEDADMNPSTNPLFDRIDKSQWKPGKNYPESNTELARQWIGNKVFDPIRDTPGFTETAQLLG